MKLFNKFIRKDLNTDANEELRRIRTLLLQYNEDRVILFANSIESKPIFQIAYELSKSFSFIDKKTVFVNFNLRSNELYNNLSIDSSNVGLEQYLTEEVKLDNLISSISNNFYLITSSKNVANSTDLLNEKKIFLLLEELRRRYDYVFIVAPSLHLCYDALIIGKLCDGILYVKEDRLPSKSILTKHASLLKQTGKPILGLVVANIDL
jgi:tyrosine-protein kinase Etk/Wzc